MRMHRCRLAKSQCTAQKNTVTIISLETPDIREQTASFRWSVRPTSALYHHEEFVMTFPESLRMDAVPEAIWWTVFLACVHSQWMFLRPCRVVLPVRLPHGEAGFWLRMVDVQLQTHEVTRGVHEIRRDVWIEEGSRMLKAVAPLREAPLCGSSFSGGKDSLLQAALLCELLPGSRPLLVATTSPMEGKSDHSTSRRRHVFAGIQSRRDVTLVEVHSTLRAAWNNGFPGVLGFQTSVNEVSDTFLYFSSLLVVAYAMGIPHLFLASEAELQENLEIDGLHVQHPHCMYSGSTQRALQKLLKRWGMSFGSLNYPLHSSLVQSLLWRRYPDLADLQYSCWRMNQDEACCNQCAQCLRVALCALSVGGNPARMGIDLHQLFPALSDWYPHPLPPPEEQLFPKRRVSLELARQMVQFIQNMPESRMELLLDGISDSPKNAETLKAYARIRQAAAGYPTGGPTGFRDDYMKWMDPLLREPLRKICAGAFPMEDPGLTSGMRERSDSLVEWITAPLERTESV